MALRDSPSKTRSSSWISMGAAKKGAEVLDADAGVRMLRAGRAARRGTARAAREGWSGCDERDVACVTEDEGEEEVEQEEVVDEVEFWRLWGAGAGCEFMAATGSAALIVSVVAVVWNGSNGNGLALCRQAGRADVRNDAQLGNDAGGQGDERRLSRRDCAAVVSSAKTTAELPGRPSDARLCG